MLRLGFLLLFFACDKISDGIYRVILDYCWDFPLRRGYTKETGNRKATAISDNCYQPELNTCY
jgi:hypothetical protein